MPKSLRQINFRIWTFLAIGMIVALCLAIYIILFHDLNSFLQYVSLSILIILSAGLLTLALFVFRPMQKWAKSEIVKLNESYLAILQAEEALLKQKKLSDTYLDVATVIFVIIDRDQAVQLINQKGCEILGYGEEDILGKNWFDHFIPQAQREKVRATFSQIIDDQLESAEYYENSVITKNGEHRLIAWHNGVMRDINGKIIATVSSGSDITAKKLLEEQMREKEKRNLLLQKSILKIAKVSSRDLDTYLKTITELVAKTLHVERVGVWFFDPEKTSIYCQNQYSLSTNQHTSGTVLYARDYPNYFRSLEESRTIAAHDAIHDPRTSEFSENYLKPFNISSMMDVPIRGQGMVFGIICHEHIGSQRTWMAEEQDFAASVADVLASNLENIERRKAEQALIESEKRLHLLVAQTPAVLWTTDQNLRFTSSQGSGLVALGLKPNQIVGMTLAEYFQKNENFLPIKVHHEALLGKPGKYEIEWGGQFFDSLIEPLHDTDQKIIGTVGVAINTTDRKHAEEKTKEAIEELRRLNHIKTEMASMVSHELRTPLSAIREGIEITLDEIDGPINEPQRETLQITKNNAERLARLITNVLDFARIESGKFQMAIDKTDIKPIILESYETIKLANHHSSVRLSLDLPQDPIVINCDAEKIKHIVMNLIENSIKFSEPAGHVQVKLYSSKNMAHIEVKDNGIGIKAEDQQKIFDLFMQASKPGQWRTGGAGVGLAVCKRLIDAHQGTITVNSTHGLGSCFTVSLPKM